MDEEVEDIVGDVKYTDSQKSVTASNVYSLDFTDSSSDKHNSSGKDTYVLEQDSDDSEKTFQLRYIQSIVNVDDVEQQHKTFRDTNVQCGPLTTDCGHSKQSVIAKEIYTQTSKTIVQLAETEVAMNKMKYNSTLETQTSFISLTKNSTVEYKIEILGANNKFTKSEDHKNEYNKAPVYITCNDALSHLEDGSSKFPVSDTEAETVINNSESSSNEDEVFRIINEESKDNILSYENGDYIQRENATDFEESSRIDSEEDSLIGNKGLQPVKTEDTSDSEVPKSVDNDTEELYHKLTEKMDAHFLEKSDEPNQYRFSALTPLTEESSIAIKDSFVQATSTKKTISNILESDKEVLLENTGLNTKILPKKEIKIAKDPFKLPPINRNQSCPVSPHVGYVFSINGCECLNKADTLACLVEGQRNGLIERWDMGSKDLASGESPFINGKIDVRGQLRTNEPLHLPPIHIDAQIRSLSVNKTEGHRTPRVSTATPSRTVPETIPESINIKERIKELKMSNVNRRPTKFHVSKSSESRSNSPGSSCSVDGQKLGDIAEKGCEALCGELMKRLRSSSWYEIAETLDDIPRAMEKFWNVITETRIADLIRQVSSHVDSPRTQVARSACSTLASILKNTNYIKKPDFYEAVTTLLIKTGSYSRPVRRAANVALDDIVCGVDINHSVTALCIHGVSHKSDLVRCSSARLLVVCAALAGGGRELLRARPPTAAIARRHALRAMAVLLEDKNNETRKYAERLYTMLRPLNNFEAYYLNDVEVETAARQMKKYDQMLICQSSRETR